MSQARVTEVTFDVLRSHGQDLDNGAAQAIGAWLGHSVEQLQSAAGALEAAGEADAAQHSHAAQPPESA